MNKQIDEMAKDLAIARGCPCGIKPCKECFNRGTCFYMEIAGILVAEGYRKQIEGEWVKSKSGLYVCSVCDKTCPYDAQADDISYWECKFCPNCGARMKGDEG